MQRFFYASGGVFFVVATILALWFAATSGGRILTFQVGEGGAWAMTTDGHLYVGYGHKWIPFGNFASKTFGREPAVARDSSVAR